MTTSIQEDICMVELAGPAGNGKSRSVKRVAFRLNGNVISDFTQHLRVIGQPEHIPAKSTLFVKDILLLHFSQLGPHFDLSIWKLPTRSVSDADRSTEFIRRQYENSVLPGMRRFVLSSKSFAGRVLDSMPDLATVKKRLSQAIAEKRALLGVR
jgi:uridine kinase